MLDTNDLTNLIKQASVDAVEAEKPVNVLFGTVTSSSPLQINVEQKMTLSSAQLVLSRNVTDYQVTMDVDFSISETSLNANHSHDMSGSISVDSTSETESTVSNSLSVDEVEIDLTHTHDYSGLQTYTVHNALVTGDEVVLLRMQGGQKFIVLDRI